MNHSETQQPPQVGGSALNVQLCDEIYYCKHCGSARLYIAFKLLCCMNCCVAYSLDDHFV